MMCWRYFTTLVREWMKLTRKGSGLKQKQKSPDRRGRLLVNTYYRTYPDVQSVF